MSEDKARDGAGAQPQPRTKPVPQPRAASSTTPPSDSGWFSIPAPLARLFKKFPLLTYPPNELPLRSPQQQRDVATLYVFISDADALKGLPSYNPTCLKWQTFLRLAGIKNLRLAPSSNHASPNGALPFLLVSGLSGSATAAAPPTQPTIIPSNKLEQYALSHARSRATSSSSPGQPSSISDIPASQNHRLESYTALLDHAVRSAWLYTLYLDPANTELLRRWYILPTSNSSIVQTTTLYQLRAAAEAEIVKSSSSGGSGGVPGSRVAEKGGQGGSNELYREARRAFAALAACLEETARERGWFFGAEQPGVFDAAVFAYTYLILLDPASGGGGGGGGGGDNGPGWAHSTLADIVREFPALVAHRDRVYELCWGGGVEA